MLQIDLGALNWPDLRRLLASAQARQDDALVRQVSEEIAARERMLAGATEDEPSDAPPWPEPAAGALTAAGASETPGEPTAPATPPEAAEDPPVDAAAIAAHPIPAEAAWADNPGDPAVLPPPDELRLTAIEQPRPDRPPWIALAATAVVAAILAGSGAWALRGWSLGHLPPPRAMSLHGAPAPPAPPQTARVPPSARSASPAAKSIVAEPASPPIVAEPRAHRTAHAETAAATETDRRPRRLDPCARPPTPADRLVCGDLALQRLQLAMRAAYGEALDAGADPGDVARTQAAWRRERDVVGDPQRLAHLYARRIDELDQAAASARRGDGPPG